MQEKILKQIQEIQQSEGISKPYNMFDPKEYTTYLEKIIGKMIHQQDEHKRAMETINGFSQQLQQHEDRLINQSKLIQLITKVIEQTKQQFEAHCQQQAKNESKTELLDKINDLTQKLDEYKLSMDRQIVQFMNDNSMLRKQLENANILQKEDKKHIKQLQNQLEQMKTQNQDELMNQLLSKVDDKIKEQIQSFENAFIFKIQSKFEKLKAQKVEEVQQMQLQISQLSDQQNNSTHQNTGSLQTAYSNRSSVRTNELMEYSSHCDISNHSHNQNQSEQIQADQSQNEISCLSIDQDRQNAQQLMAQQQNQQIYSQGSVQSQNSKNQGRLNLSNVSSSESISRAAAPQIQQQAQAQQNDQNIHVSYVPDLQIANFPQSQSVSMSNLQSPVAYSGTGNQTDAAYIPNAVQHQAQTQMLVYPRQDDPQVDLPGMQVEDPGPMQPVIVNMVPVSTQMVAQPVPQQIPQPVQPPMQLAPSRIPRPQVKNSAQSAYAVQWPSRTLPVQYSISQQQQILSAVPIDRQAMYQPQYNTGQVTANLPTQTAPPAPVPRGRPSSAPQEAAVIASSLTSSGSLSRRFHSAINDQSLHYDQLVQSYSTPKQNLQKPNQSRLIQRTMTQEEFKIYNQSINEQSQANFNNKTIKELENMGASQARINDILKTLNQQIIQQKQELQEKQEILEKSQMEWDIYGVYDTKKTPELTNKERFQVQMQEKLDKSFRQSAHKRIQKSVKSIKKTIVKQNERLK